MKLKVFVFVSFLIILSAPAQVVYDLENNDQISMINAISGLNNGDDGISRAQAPIIAVDLNNNGILDYITAMSGSDFLYIYFDQQDFTEQYYYPHEGPNLIITGAAYLGSAFASGDFNGDGIADVLVGAYRELGDGEAFVIFGSESLPTTGFENIYDLANVRLAFSGFSGNQDFFGLTLSTADMNNDGYDEIIVGAPVIWSFSGRGSVYIIYGSLNLPSVINTRTEADVIIEGGGVWEHIGRHLDKGDYNNDGYEDLVFVSAHWPGPGANGERGKAWILFGSNSLPSYFNTSQTYSQITGFSGQNQSDEMAHTATGDINGDGIDDLLLSSLKYDAPISYLSTNNFGKIYINYGPITPGENYDDVEGFNSQTKIYPHPEDLTTSQTYMYIGSRFGQSLNINDINGDGYDDILIGAPGYSRWPATGSQTNEGAAFLILGGNYTNQILYQDSQYMQFIASNEVDSSRNVEFGRSVSFLRINEENKLHVAIKDLARPWVYLFDITSTLNLNETLKDKIYLIYPNPTKDYIRLITDRSELSSYQLFNITGEIIEKQIITSNSTKIYLANLPSSVYLLRVFKNNHIVKSFKIIKN